jgi:hypothetical protein
VCRTARPGVPHPHPLYPLGSEGTMKISTLLAPALCLALAACNDQALSVVCPDEAPPAVVVGVVDVNTRVSAASESYGWFTVFGVTDSLRHGVRVEGVPQLFAFGPPGVYQVRVQRPGHADWVQSNVVVHEALCGPATVQIEATLQPMQ